MFDARDIVGRKSHTCDECGGPIAPRERHEVVSGNWDGCWARYRTCLPCVSLRDAVIAHEEEAGCYGAEAHPPLGDLWACAIDADVVCAWPDDDAREIAREYGHG